MVNAPLAADHQIATEDWGYAEQVSDEKVPEITLEEFLALEPEPGIKHEWVDGKLIKTEKLMSEYQLYIILNIREKFQQTETYKSGLGSMESEFDSRLKPRTVRRPDMGFVTKKQIYAVADVGGQIIPSFAVEIISPNEKYGEAEQKIADYFAAGVQVVWQIFPELKKVKVIRPGQPTEELAASTAICSADPAVADFQMTVGEVFGKP